MMLIPSLILKDGACLQPGDGQAQAEAGTVAARLVAAGAKRLHVVDLDAAAGRAPNLAALRAVVAAADGAPVQVAGGVRSEETAAALLEAGAEFVVIGTRALTTQHLVEDLSLEFPGHIIVSLDVRDGRLALEGWSKFAQHSVAEIAQHLEREGVAAFVYTDLARDGQMAGANIEAAAALARVLSVPVFVAGGLADAAELPALAAVVADGVAGAIVGRALREGRLTLPAV